MGSKIKPARVISVMGSRGTLEKVAREKRCPEGDSWAGVGQ